MTEMKTNRTANLIRFLLCLALVLFGLRLVGSVLFNPYGTGGSMEATMGIVLILSGLILPFFLLPKTEKHTETPSDENQ
jgi:hypothetical protein